MKPSTLLLHSFIAAASARTSQPPTWPSPVHDELEELMTQYSGYRKMGFADGVQFCGFFPLQEPGRMAAAEWIRTAYHDMATADVAARTGGLDASLVFETDRPENPGAALTSSFGFFVNFFNARVSMADLIALGVNTATRMCGGPFVSYRAGRIDATAAGPFGVPEPQESLANFTQKFARQGFSVEEMIGLVACGHTLGGVHSKDFPQIVPNGSQPDTSAHFDSTRTQFDNTIVTEYLNNNSSDPLLVGPAETNSDQKIFSSDRNVTMKALANPKVFQNTCATLFAKMIDTVPSSVQLTPVIVPYEVKPKEVRLTIAGNTTLNFGGDIRVRTTIRKNTAISKAEIVYMDVENQTHTVEVPRQTFIEGLTSSLDDEFTWYTFNTVIPSSSAVTSYSVKITLTNGQIETHDNNGVQFPVMNLIFFQPSASCGGNFVDVNTPINSTIVAAVHQSRLSLPNPIVKVTARKLRTSTPIVPELVESQFTMEPWTGADAPVIPKEYAWFRVTYPLDFTGFDQQTFDIVSGSGANAVVDDFRDLGFDIATCGGS